jgi:hypothetical protein
MNGTGTCGNCSHAGSEHSDEEQREVMLICQELAAGGKQTFINIHCSNLKTADHLLNGFFMFVFVGELFGLLMHCG